jgi:hypothetical protein
MAVANQDSGVCVHQALHDLVVVLIGRREHQCSQSVALVNGGMQLESVVLTLPVLPELGNTFGYFVPVSSNGLTNW